MPHASASIPTSLLSRAATGALALLASACGGDDPACVFGGNCFTDGTGTPGALGSQALPPENGTWAEVGAPDVELVFPDGDGQATTTPVVIRFSESMNFSTLQAAFQIATGFADPFNPFDPTAGGLTLVPFASALVGDGRVLVLLPTEALDPEAEYRVEFTPVAEPTDVTGELLVVPEDPILATFTVAATDPVQPQVVATWPPNNAANQSATTEVVVVFDRPADATTVSTSSFVVTLDGADPAANPEPEAFTLGAGPFALADTRVFRWRSVDEDGADVALGLDVAVDVALAPDTAPIEFEDASTLAASIGDFGFQTAAFAAPLTVALVSDPNNAIGTRQLTAGSGNEAEVALSLAGAQASDEIVLYIFGNTPVASAADPEVLVAGDLVAVRRTSAPESDGLSASINRAQLELIRDDFPVFFDGTIAFAAQVVRGGVESPLTVLDSDLDTDGIQDVTLDTTAPTFTGLTFAGVDSTGVFRSDQRDLVLTGRSGDTARRVVVTTDALGSNGLEPEVLGVSADNVFVAAPVPLGLVSTADLPVVASATVLDAALNESDAIEFEFTQFGAVGPRPYDPGDAITVTAFNSVLLDPIANALVVVEAVVDDGMAPTFTYETGRTDDVGRVTLPTPSIGIFSLSVTVDAAGFDLVTFFTPTAERIDVPLTPTEAQGAQVEGQVASTDGAATALLGLGVLQGYVGDSRQTPGSLPLVSTAACEGGLSGSLGCDFGPLAIGAERFGALSYLAGDLAVPTEDDFESAPEAVLQAFVFDYPAPPTTNAGVDSVVLEVTGLLSATTGGVPVETERITLDAGSVVAVDPPEAGRLGTLLDDPATTGEPLVVVEAALPGIPGTVPVGLGLAFGAGGAWSVRGAHAAVAGVGGELSARGTLEEDLFLRMELRDTDGNRSVRRPRLSQIADSIVVAPPRLPVLAGGGDLFDGAVVATPTARVAFADALFGDGENVLYALDLRDAAGRGWSLFTSAESDGGAVFLSLPDLGAAGASRLADGVVTASTRVWSWSGFDPAEFLWSDVERSYESFASTAAFEFELALGM